MQRSIAFILATPWQGWRDERAVTIRDVFSDAEDRSIIGGQGLSGARAGHGFLRGV
jgi:hypothetical protein